jgi:squalene-associated FAD-dependent desaturase
LKLQGRFEALLLAPQKKPARLRAARLPAPLHLAPSLLSYRLLNPMDRLRIVRAVLAARHSVDENETFAGWLQRHGQNPATRQAFWDPFLVPALNAPLEEVAARDALFVIRTAFLHDSGAARFGYSLVPLAHIAEAAAARLHEVHRRTPVASLDMGDSGNLRGIVLEDGGSVRCDAAVLALPPQRLLRLLGNAEAFGVFGLEAFQTTPIIDVHLWYDRETLGFDFAALIGSPIQWVFEKGRGYLCCSMSAAQTYIGLSGAELVRLCHEELAAMIPSLHGAKLIRGAATRDREATFVPSPGLKRPGPSTTSPGVVIAGAWTDTGWPATMESAIRSGRAAAQALLQTVPTRERVAVA